MDGVREQWRVRAPNLYTINCNTMDNTYPHYLTQKERTRINGQNTKIRMAIKRVYRYRGIRAMFTNTKRNS